MIHVMPSGTEFTMLWTRDYEDYFYKDGDIFDIIAGDDEDTPSETTVEQPPTIEGEMDVDMEDSGFMPEDIFAEDDEEEAMDAALDVTTDPPVPKELDASKLAQFFRSPLYKHWKGFVRMAPGGQIVERFWFTVGCMCRDET